MKIWILFLPMKLRLDVASSILWTVYLIIIVYGIRCWFKERHSDPKIDTINLIIWLTCLTLLVYGMGKWFIREWNWNKAMKWNDMEQSVSQVRVDGINKGIDEVKIVRIPQTVYENLDKKTTRKEHFLGAKKHVVVGSIDGFCQYWDSFVREINDVFKNEKIRKTYELTIYNADPGHENCEYTPLPYADHATVEEMRKAYQHPCRWIETHCRLSMCIINPQTHEAVIDSSQHPEQILPLLKTYENWKDEPLLP